MAWQIERLESPQWIDEFQNLIIIGVCEKGKTSLASHLGRMALEAGEKVSYLTINRLLEIIERKEHSDKYQRWSRYIARSSVVIIDDMMYARIPADKLPRL